jgi:hypothetical protein
MLSAPHALRDRTTSHEPSGGALRTAGVTSDPSDLRRAA